MKRIALFMPAAALLFAVLPIAARAAAETPAPRLARSLPADRAEAAAVRQRHNAALKELFSACGLPAGSGESDVRSRAAAIGKLAEELRTRAADPDEKHLPAAAGMASAASAAVPAAAPTAEAVSLRQRHSAALKELFNACGLPEGFSDEELKARISAIGNTSRQLRARAKEPSPKSSDGALPLAGSAAAAAAAAGFLAGRKTVKP